MIDKEKTSSENSVDVLDPIEETPSTEPKLTRTYKTRTKVAAFIFFVITLGVFVLYEFFAINFLYMPSIKGVDDFGEAVAAVFGYTFGLILTIIFGIAQLPENIVSIILFSRLRGKSDKKWENTLFTVFFAISIVMLLVMILTIAFFFLFIARS